MRLAWHQFCKDVRYARVLLLGLGVLLFLDLVQTQGWWANRNWVAPFDSRDLHHFGINWIIGALVGGCGVMAFTAVFRDSPHRENSFIRTRPMPASSLWGGKILFLGTFVLAPLVLIEMVNLTLHGLEGKLVWAGTWERLTLVLPVLIIICAVSGAAENSKSPVISIVVGYVSGMIGIGLIAIAVRGFGLSNTNENVDGTVIRHALFVLAALLVGFAIWEIRHRPRPWLRWTVLGSMVIATEWFALYAPTNPAMAGLAQAEVTKLAEKAELRLPLNSVGLAQGESKPGLTSIGWTPSPRLDHLPADWIVRWQRCSAELKTANGETHHALPYSNTPLVFPRYYSLANEDMRSIGGGLPEGSIIESQSGHSSRRSMGYRTFDLPPRGQWREGKAQLSVHGHANVYQWKQVADLELKRGVAKKDGLTQWQILALAVKPEHNQIQVVFEQSGPGLQMSADQQLRRSGRWPANRYEFLIYDPVNKLARGQEHRSSSTGSVGGHTAFQRRTTILRFQEGSLRQPGWKSHPESLRLLVFRMDYLGTLEKTLATQISPKRHRAWYGNQYSNTDRISREDYLRRLAELEVPGENASRTVVGNYVHAILQLIEAHRRHHDNDPGVVALTALASKYPEIFLDGYSVADGDSRRALFQALRNGLQPEQKSLVIARLDEQPNLADLLNERGWQDDAREELFGLLDHHSSLPYAALKSLASFNDPKADERILREVRETRGDNAYQIAERLPRLADRIDQIVTERWNNRSHHYRTHGSLDHDLALAIRHGNPVALAELIRLLSLHNPQRGSMSTTILSTLGGRLNVPGMDRRDRYNTDKVRSVLLAARDRQFRYNRVLKQFEFVEANSENN